MITACINCLDRHIACHDTCPKYQEQHKKGIRTQETDNRSEMQGVWDNL